MGRSLALPLITALGLTLFAGSIAAAREPIALGLATDNSADMASVASYEASYGAGPALWTLWSTWGDRGGRSSCDPDAGSCAFPRAAARALGSRGITPFIWWQPSDPGNEAACVYGHRSIIRGTHDAYIRDWARAAKAYRKPLIVRWAHEMNGDWFPWSQCDGNPTRYQQAWRHIVREFRSVGARNVRFLWSPYPLGTGSRGFRDFYPGNSYVDYVGFTSLNWGNERWKELSRLLEQPMAALRQITRTNAQPQGKPVILPEVASIETPGDKAAWIRDGYAQAYKRWPSIRAMVYFDIDRSPQGERNWTLASPSDGSAIHAYGKVATKPAFRGSIP